MREIYNVYYEELNLKEGLIMKKFFEDYGELLKANGRFYKKHWKGCIVLSAVSLATSFGARELYYKRQLKKEQFSEDEEL